MPSSQTVSLSRFRLADRLTAWGVFIIALLSYWLMVEPTVSYWDCPEYVAVADKLMVGHSPGNPVWMLAARFVINFAPDVAHKALMVNLLSGLFTALAVLFLYRTTLLLLLWGRFGRSDEFEKTGSISKSRAIRYIAAGAVGALALCWSDSIWFSAVEAEVYAFSIFMTALTLYVTLLWGWRYHGKPHGDRWLILAAYLIGVGMGVHELNLLCIVPMALTVWFMVARRKGPARAWLSLTVGCVAVVVILFLLVPGFLRFAQAMELWTVNRMHLSFNSGFLTAWVVVFLLLLGASLWFTLTRSSRLWLRIAGLTSWCTLMLFLGFSSYALIVIRGAANPPLNTGSPGNPFSFTSYYQREQYGSSPLIRGYAFKAPRLKVESKDASGHKSYYKYYNSSPKPMYVQGRKGDKALLRSNFASPADSLQAAADSRRTDDYYMMSDYSFEVVKSPEMLMWFPRMYSDNLDDIEGYYSWTGMSHDNMVQITEPTLAVDEQGRPVRNPQLPKDTLYRPTYLQNFAYLLGYQMGFMYWRYFMWNFMGRQNDLPGHGEPDAGLPVTGIAPLDRLWTDPQGTMPAEGASENPGRNIYWFLPLALGLAGMIWQVRKRGRNRQGAAIVAALFFFTGVAIVLYLNQPPTQARDRDYAFLGSYYAFCVWIGIGVMPLYALCKRMLSKRRKETCAWLASALALIVPLQILSQTADDHDRSGRTVTPDFAHNILAPLPEGAILFVAGDNNTFPLWYMQATEEERRDVRIVNLTYLSDNDYAASLMYPAWDAPALRLRVPERHLIMGRYSYASLPFDSTWRDLRQVLDDFYATQSGSAFPRLNTSRVYMPYGEDTIRINLRRIVGDNGLVRQNLLLLLDILSSSDAPLYWLSNDLDGPFNGELMKYLHQEGPVKRVAAGYTPPSDRKVLEDARRLYRWGGLDSGRKVYYDPLAKGRVADMRRSLIVHAANMSRDPSGAPEALEFIELIMTRMPESAVPYQAWIIPQESPEGDTSASEEELVEEASDEGTELALAMWEASHASSRPGSTRAKALELLRRQLKRAEGWERYMYSLPEDWRKYISDSNRAYAIEAPRLRMLVDSLTNLSR